MVDALLDWIEERWQRGHRTIIAVVLPLVIVAVGLAGLAHHRHPRRTVEAFLAACETQDYPALYALMEPAYRQALDEQASQKLLTALHQYVPRRYRIWKTGQARINGLPVESNRFRARVKFEEPESARERHQSFAVCLVRGRNGQWYVAYQQTYQSLLISLYGQEARQYLKRVSGGLIPASS